MKRHILCAINFLILTSGIASADCLHYEHASLTGFLSQAIIYQKNPYEDDSKPATRYVVPVLMLKPPVCFQASGDLGPAEANVQEIGIFFPGPWKNFVKQFAGRRVTVVGILYHAALPHDYRPVMMDTKVPPTIVGQK